MEMIGKIYGKQVSWVFNNCQEMFDTLIGPRRNIKKKDLYDFGDKIFRYSDQIKNCLVEFAKNVHNKDSILENFPQPNIYIGVRIRDEENKKNEPYFVIDNGCIWMSTKIDHFSDYLYNFSCDNLEKIMTVMFWGQWGPAQSISLTCKKGLVEAQTKVTTMMNDVAKVWQEQWPLTFVDLSQTIYNDLKDAQKRFETIDVMGSAIVRYVEQLKTTLLEFLKNADNKQQLQKEVYSYKIAIRMVKADQIDESFSPYFWKIDEGALYMQFKVDHWSDYLYNFSVDNLEKILGEHDPMPLLTRKKVTAVTAAINKNMEHVGKLLGRQVYWVYNNIQELYDTLIGPRRNIKKKDYHDNFGNNLKNYSDQVKTIMDTFTKNADNKDAFLENFPQQWVYVGVRIREEGSTDGFLVLENGCLWMTTKIDHFGDYLYNFSSDNLEKIL